MIYDIINELNLENGSNYKLSVLKKYVSNKLLERVLKMTYDKVTYTYGMSLSSLDKFIPEEVNGRVNLEESLDWLEYNVCNRKVTGHEALQLTSNLIGRLEQINSGEAEVLRRVINRDLRINLGKTLINKVFKDLIKKPVYMRCDVYSSKTAKNINFSKLGAYVQIKADGTYREFFKDDDKITSRSRSGEEYHYPVINEQMKDFPNGFYMGELTVQGIANRSEGNGLINSDEPPHDLIQLDLWDYVTTEEYHQAQRKDKKNQCRTSYYQRFETLYKIVNQRSQLSNIKTIPYKVVHNLKDALIQTSKWMDEGFEGSILKDFDGIFKDGTSKQQLKLKLKISAEMRCTGFKEGTKGTKREGKVGSILFENDEGTIKGSCSGFSDKELDYFTENQDILINRVIEVEFNDLTKGHGNDHYALSHPRFVEFRNDKNETDTLDKVFKLREMAIELKG